MFLSRFLLPFFALVSTAMPRVFASESESSDDNCIATLEELEAVMSLPRTDDSIVTYVLCTDTEYFTGETFDIFTGTSFPIIPRSNSKIQCGEDGSSDDNCVVSGNIGFISSSFLSSGNPLDPIVNVSVEGLTFKGGEFANAGILLAAEGDITFTDCIIEVRSHPIRSSSSFSSKYASYLILRIIKTPELLAFCSLFLCLLTVEACLVTKASTTISSN